MSQKISVIGAGAWGTAFSIHLAKLKKEVCLWIYERDLFEIIGIKRENTFYLPGFILPDDVKLTYELDYAANYSENIVFAVPSYALRKVMEKMGKEALKDKNILILTKGLEAETCKRMSEVAEEILMDSGERIAVLSGPSFAREVASGVFTSVVIASQNKDCAKYFQRLAHGLNLRVYTSDDVVGVELGGALKNVMAIGAGIIQGLSLGTNTLSAYITRALAEMKRFGKAFGAKESTFMGLSGVGDLILTSFGPLSRNRYFGMEIAKGKSPKEVLESQKGVIEGYYTLFAVYNLSQRMKIEMPITSELYQIVYEGKSIEDSIKHIKEREMKEEE
ncbi:MAG: NAD(P)-dependent glycerol-3-phosphate dehydrogenase [Desulfobacterota bacterium]|nr:NAD(P)-dependent glycerol-3-phosphate dehydrogenase [Thermodesulfobacteriota bacterium]MDW8001168.1 NAD(P)H-dependent glycerol-3-phosphate dehydrogenase [Deltaproteobacteria bacterium]